MRIANFLYRLLLWWEARNPYVATAHTWAMKAAEERGYATALDEHGRLIRTGLLHTIEHCR